MSDPSIDNTPNLTVRELLTLGEQITERFRTLDYDNVRFLEVTISGREYIEHGLKFELTDDFQSKLNWDEKYKSGYETIPLDKAWSTVMAWPNREQRELAVLAKRLAFLDTDEGNDIRSAQARAFVERMKPNMEELRRQLGYNPNVEIT